MKKFLFFYLMVVSVVDSFSQSTFIKSFNSLGIYSPRISLLDDHSLVLFSAVDGPVTGVEIMHLDSDGNILAAKKNYCGIVGIEEVHHDQFGNWIILSSWGQLLKLDSAFNFIWEKEYHEITSEHFIIATGLHVTNNGLSYYVTGFIDSLLLPHDKSLFVMKTDSIGIVQWANYYDAQDSLLAPFEHTQEYGSSIHPGNDGNLIIGGTSSNDSSLFNTQSKAVFRIDTAGNFVSCYLQEDPFIMSNGPFDLGITSLVVLANDNLLISGSFHPNPFSSFTTAYVMETDSILNPIWVQYVDVKSISSDWRAYPVRMVQDSGGNIYFGYTNINSIPQLEKITSVGQRLWAMEYAPPASVGFLYDINIGAGIPHISFNISQSVDTIFAVKTDATGNAGCYSFTGLISGTGTLQSGLPAFFQYKKYPFYLNTFDINSGDSMAVITSTVYCDEVLIKENENEIFQIAPNPFCSNVNLNFDGEQKGSATLLIINSIGVKVLERETKQISQQLSLIFLPPGIYNLMVITEAGRYVKTIVKE